LINVGKPFTTRQKTEVHPLQAVSLTEQDFVHKIEVFNKNFYSG
jgi:hypothetical protein